MTQYPCVNKYYTNGSREYRDLFFLSVEWKAVLNKKTFSDRNKECVLETLYQKQEFNNAILALNDNYFNTLQKMSRLGKEVCPISEY